MSYHIYKVLIFLPSLKTTMLLMFMKLAHYTQDKENKFARIYLFREEYG